MASRRHRGEGSDADDVEPAPDDPPPRADADADHRGDERGRIEGDADLDDVDETDDLDETDSLDETDDVDEAGATEGEAAVPAGERRRSALDAKTLAICTLVALIAALAAGLLVSRLTDGGGTEAAPPEGTLTLAEEVPDVALTRFDGTEVSLSDYTGQPLVVNFWGSWCQPCVDEMPDLEAVHTSLGEDVAFLGVNIRDEPEAAQALAERTGVTYDLVRDVDGDLTRALGVTNFPTTVLILPDGTVIDTIQRKVSSQRLCEKVTQSLLGGSTQECG